jgi:hypothetical protein
MIETVQVDYQTLVIMVVAVFGLAGFLRGWWKEAITMGLLTFLLILLRKPDTAALVVGSIESAVTAIWDLLQSIVTASDVASSAVSVADTTTPAMDPGNYSIYIIIMIVLIIASYFLGKVGLSGSLSAGARILGALIGFYNGFVIVSLVMEYVIGRYLPGNEIAAASAPPDVVALEVTNLPAASIADEPLVYFLIGTGAIVFVVALMTGLSVQRISISRKTPPLHGGEPAKGS